MFILMLKCMLSILVFFVVRLVSIDWVVFIRFLIVVEFMGELMVVFLIKLFRCEFLLLSIGVFMEIGFLVIFSILCILFFGIFRCMFNFLGVGLWFIF